ncbi:hypothetical protein N9N13_07210 [Opitutales bacterium]|nr:hypothetical protein [Opitutales bacterium]
MSINDETINDEKIDLKVPKDSNFAFIFTGLGVLFLFGTLLMIVQCNSVSNYSGKADQAAIAAISCFVLCFNCFFASHIISILANARWSLNQIAQNTLHKKSDTLSLSSVIDEFKKISEQNKEQSESLKKSIDELSEKANNTNSYLYHIYKK